MVKGSIKKLSSIEYPTQEPLQRSGASSSHSRHTRASGTSCERLLPLQLPCWRSRSLKWQHQSQFTARHDQHLSAI